MAEQSLGNACLHGYNWSASVWNGNDFYASPSEFLRKNLRDVMPADFWDTRLPSETPTASRALRYPHLVPAPHRRRKCGCSRRSRPQMVCHAGALQELDLAVSSNLLEFLRMHSLLGANRDNRFPHLRLWSGRHA